jgi:hypothetical protein
VELFAFHIVQLKLVGFANFWRVHAFVSAPYLVSFKQKTGRAFARAVTRSF